MAPALKQIMKKNVLNSYVIDRLLSVEKNLSAYAKDKHPEHLHRLRVDIKKVKAVFSFVDKVYEEENDTNDLKTMFDDAGKIREIEINIQLLLAFQH